MFVCLCRMKASGHGEKQPAASQSAANCTVLTYPSNLIDNEQSVIYRVFIKMLNNLNPLSLPWLRFATPRDEAFARSV